VDTLDSYHISFSSHKKSLPVIVNDVADTIRETVCGGLRGGLGAKTKNKNRIMQHNMVCESLVIKYSFRSAVGADKLKRILRQFSA
jgi:hypothetical protein